jgi:hypothetical protein
MEKTFSMKFIILLSCLLCFRLQAKEGLSFIVISDVHFGRATVEAGEPATNLWYLSTNIQDAQFIIDLGDCGDLGAASEYVEALMTESWFSIPYLRIGGNHDAWNYLASNSENFTNYMQAIGYTNGTLTVGNWKFVGISSTVPPPGDTSQGYVHPDQLVFLERELSNATHLVTWVCTHHPVESSIFTDFAPGFPWGIKLGFGLEGMTNILLRWGADGYLHGHTHSEQCRNTWINPLRTTWQCGMGAVNYGWQGMGHTNGCFQRITVTNTTMTIKQYSASRSNNYPLLGTYTFQVPRYGTNPIPAIPVNCSTLSVGRLTIQ